MKNNKFYFILGLCLSMAMPILAHAQEIKAPDPTVDGVAKEGSSDDTAYKTTIRGGWAAGSGYRQKALLKGRLSIVNPAEGVSVSVEPAAAYDDDFASLDFNIFGLRTGAYGDLVDPVSGTLIVNARGRYAWGSGTGSLNGAVVLALGTSFEIGNFKCKIFGGPAAGGAYRSKTNVDDPDADREVQNETFGFGPGVSGSCTDGTTSVSTNNHLLFNMLRQRDKENNKVMLSGLNQVTVNHDFEKFALFGTVVSDNYFKVGPSALGDTQVIVGVDLAKSKSKGGKKGKRGVAEAAPTTTPTSMEVQ